MSRSRVVFRVIVGGYLAYTGFSLVGNAMSDRPENYVLYTVIGILFLIIGVAWCASALIRFARHDYDDGLGEGPAIEEETAEEEPVLKDEAAAEEKSTADEMAEDTAETQAGKEE